MNELEKRLAAYRPCDETEQLVRQEMLAILGQKGAAVLSREEPMHFTASAFVVNRTFNRVLLIRHKQYGTLSFTGGHADGESDLLAVAVREAAEEAGASVVPFVSAPVSLDILPVPAHKRQGEPIQAHRHLSVTFACIADENRKGQSGESLAEWVALSDLAKKIEEEHMLALYRKCLCRIDEWRQAKQAVLAELPDLLLPWYNANKRDLPWRHSRDPYRVWLAEIMLQQTRVEAVRGYYERFLQALPDVYALAACDDDKLNKLWEGLGYYSRARNLRRAAKVIVTECGGQFPSTREELLRLPGVGAYTAGAVASIAFGRREAAVDGNVLRVAARLAEYYYEIGDIRWREELSDALCQVYPKTGCGDFTQSFMDLGSAVCLPASPRCEVCPLSEICMARAAGTVGRLPVRARKAARIEQKRTVFVLHAGDALAVRKRPETGLLAGLWELPNTEGHLDEKAAQTFLRENGLVAEGDFMVTAAKHVFTHLTWQMRVYHFSCSRQGGAFVWCAPHELQTEISLPTAFRCCLVKT